MMNSRCSRDAAWVLSGLRVKSMREVPSESTAEILGLGALCEIGNQHEVFPRLLF